MPQMRAKMRLTSVTQHETCEVLKFNAVGRSSCYPADGSDEDNTYGKYTPSAELSLTVANPALLRQFKPGETYYLDFTPVAVAVDKAA